MHAVPGRNAGSVQFLPCDQAAVTELDVAVVEVASGPMLRVASSKQALKHRTLALCPFCKETPSERFLHCRPLPKRKLKGPETSDLCQVSCVEGTGFEKEAS